MIKKYHTKNVWLTYDTTFYGLKIKRLLVTLHRMIARNITHPGNSLLGVLIYCLIGLMLSASLIGEANSAEPAPYGSSSATSAQKRQWDKEALSEDYETRETRESSREASREHTTTSPNATGVYSTNAPIPAPPPMSSGGTGIPGGFLEKANTDFKNITYFVVNQPLQAVMSEIIYLAGLQVNTDQLPEVTVTNTLFQGSVDKVMDQLAKRYGFIWNIENGVIDVAPLKSLITRSIKLEGMSEERIAELLAAAGIPARKDVIALDESTNILRIRGTPKYVAKAEAAILLGKTTSAGGTAPDDQVHVVRAGRTSRVVNPN
jgi:hypothetical protein